MNDNNSYFDTSSVCVRPGINHFFLQINPSISLFRLIPIYQNPEIWKSYLTGETGVGTCSQLSWHWISCYWLRCGYLDDDVIKWNHFPRNCPFVRGILPVPVNSPHNGQWRGALMFSLICVWINDWVNYREAGDLRRHRGHYDVNIMEYHLVSEFIHFSSLCFSSSILSADAYMITSSANILRTHLSWVRLEISLMNSKNKTGHSTELWYAIFHI